MGNGQPRRVEEIFFQSAIGNVIITSAKFANLPNLKTMFLNRKLKIENRKFNYYFHKTFLMP